MILRKFAEMNCMIAEEQPEYIAMPAYRAGDVRGSLICCWELSLAELSELIRTRKIWHTIQTFNNSLQPQLLQTDKPDMRPSDQQYGEPQDPEPTVTLTDADIDSFWTENGGRFIEAYFESSGEECVGAATSKTNLYTIMRSMMKALMQSTYKLARQPANWDEDSSLETWFPLTAEDLRRYQEILDPLTMVLYDTARATISDDIVFANKTFAQTKEILADLPHKVYELKQTLAAHKTTIEDQKETIEQLRMQNNLLTQARKAFEERTKDIQRVLYETLGNHATFQARVEPWMMVCFGEMIAGDKEERAQRHLEECLELVQAAGMPQEHANQLVSYVYGRPVGELKQEVGGVMVTLAALCLAHQQDMHVCAELELKRIWTKVDQIREKQKTKPMIGPLPGAYPEREKEPSAKSDSEGFTQSTPAPNQPLP